MSKTLRGILQMNALKRALQFAMVALVASCAGTIGTLMSGGDLAKELQKRGWTPVDFPREILGPGSIVSITDTEGIRFRGRVESCLPRGLLKVERKAAALPSETKNTNLGAQAFLKFNKIAKLHPGFNEIRRVVLTIGTTEEVFVEEILLTRLFMEHAKNFDQVCRNYFLQPSIHIITSALQVNDYSYTFYQKSDITLELSLERLKNLFDLGADVKYEILRDGSLKIKEPLFIAFRTAQYFSLTEMPRVGPVEGAASIMERYYRLSGARFGE